VDRQAKEHFDAVVASLDINLKNASGPMLGTAQNPEAYNLYKGLIDLTRGIYYALDDFDSRLRRIEQAISSQK
jgi:hypothetical protein